MIVFWLFMIGFIVCACYAISGKPMVLKLFGVTYRFWWY